MRKGLAAALACLATGAAAATAHPTSVEQLARTSDAVVSGRVARLSARWTPDHARIVTLVELEVGAVWRGAAPALLTLVVPGGVVGELGQRVDGAPGFAEGEAVAVFLSRAGGETYRVNGFAQGKFSLQGARARPDLAHTTLLDEPLRRGERRVEAMPVAELERLVRSAR